MVVIPEVHRGRVQVGKPYRDGDKANDHCGEFDWGRRCRDHPEDSKRVASAAIDGRFVNSPEKTTRSAW